MLPELPECKALISPANEMMTLGCRDPLIYYLYVCACIERNYQLYQNMAEQAYRRMLNSEYSSFMKLAAGTTWVDSLENVKADYQSALAEVTTMAKTVLSKLDKPQIPHDQRMMLAQYRKLMRLMSFPQRAVFCDEIEKIDTHYSWMKNVIIGQYHRDQAWELRGSGWASEVTDAGWEGFHDHLEKARRYLEQAWRIEPSLPQAPQIMVEISMIDDHDNPRQWLERTARAQLDFLCAYRSYVWYARPRWCGSHETMYQRGLECLNTNRFDTDLPLYFRQVMDDIREDSGSYDFWREHNVYPQFEKLYDNMAKQPDAGHQPQWYESMKVATAWRSGAWRKALDLIEHMDGELVAEQFAELDGDPDLAVSEIHARLSPAGELLDEADEHVRSEQFTPAIEVLEQANAMVETDSPSAYYISHYLKMCTWKHRINLCVWLELAGDKCIGDDLSGWHQAAGRWYRDEAGRLVGESTRDGLALIFDPELGYRFAMEGEVTCESQLHPNYINAAVFYEWFDLKCHRSICMYPAQNHVKSAVNFGYYDEDTECEMNNSFRFHLEVWDEQLRLVINDDCMHFHDFNDYEYEVGHMNHPMAIGGRYWYDKNTIRFNQLRLRRLPLEPDWLAGEDEDDQQVIEKDDDKPVD